jgi:hypothetical protein
VANAVVVVLILMMTCHIKRGPADNSRLSARLNMACLSSSSSMWHAMSAAGTDRRRHTQVGWCTFDHLHKAGGHVTCSSVDDRLVVSC